MTSIPKTGETGRSLPDDIAVSAGLPRGHLADRNLNDDVDASAHDLRDKAENLRDHAADTAGDLRDQATRKVNEVRDRVGDTVQDVRARASDTYDDAKGWVADARDSGRRRIEDLSDRGSERFHDGKSAVEDFVSENPLLVGVVGLAAGLLLGALLPRTRSEDKAVGPWADEVRDQGLRYARDVTSRGREFVASALDPDNLNAAVQRATDQPGAVPPRPERPVSRPH